MDSSWVFRGANCLAALRSAAIFDSIRKDDQAHQYEWMLQIANDLSIVEQGPRHVVLGWQLLGRGRAIASGGRTGAGLQRRKARDAILCS